MSLLAYSPHSINIKSKDSQIDNHLMYFPLEDILYGQRTSFHIFYTNMGEAPTFRPVLWRQLSPDSGAPVATKLKCPRLCSAAVYLCPAHKRPLSLLPLMKNALGLRRGQKERGRKQGDWKCQGYVKLNSEESHLLWNSSHQFCVFHLLPNLLQFPGFKWDAGWNLLLMKKYLWVLTCI